MEQRLFKKQVGIEKETEPGVCEWESVRLVRIVFLRLEKE